MRNFPCQKMKTKKLASTQNQLNVLAFAIMIQEGYVTRVDVFQPGIATPEGIRVGNSEARAKQAYGDKLKIEPHAYTGPEGHYLTVRSSDGLYGIRFETDGKKILSFYAGKKAAIAYIEGCQ